MYVCSIIQALDKKKKQINIDYATKILKTKYLVFRSSVMHSNDFQVPQGMDIEHQLMVGLDVTLNHQ